MWAVEKDPALRSDFCNLTILEHAPSDERVQPTLARAVAAIPRLGQRVVGAPLRIVPPEFTDDPMLDLSAHVHRVAVPGKGDERALLDLCGSLAEQPFDRARPLWEFTIIEGLEGGRAALLQKIHHTITDGVGGLKLSLAFVDFEADPEAPPAAPAFPDANGERRHPTPLTVTRAALADAAARNVGMARRVIADAGQVLMHPGQLPARATSVARLVRSLQRQALATASRSDVMRGRSLRRHFEVFARSLVDTQVSARKLGGSVNDVYVTAIAGALGRYHARLGSDVEELRLALPVSTRSRWDSAANRFVPARLLVPIQPFDDPHTLFAAVHERLLAVRDEAAIDAAEGLAVLLTGLPTAFLVAMTRAQTRTTDLAATNLRGSPVPLYLAGARVIANYPFGPRAGTALNATALSYCDELHVGLNIDPSAVTDVPAFMRDLEASYDALLSLD